MSVFFTGGVVVVEREGKVHKHVSEPFGVVERCNE